MHGALKQPPEFLRHNLLRIAEVQELEAKGRRRDLLISDNELYAFYAEYIPADICRLSDLNRWLRRTDETTRQRLYLEPADLLRQNEALATQEDFPSELAIDELKLPLHYRFAPGEADDGVTVDVSVGLLAALGAER